MNQRVRILFCDHLSLARGKFLPAAQAAGGEARFCLGVYALAYDKDLIPAPGAKMLEGLPDMVARFDLEQARDGWLGDERVVVCDQFDTAGAPLGVCGRAALKRAVADWQARGYTPKIGVELEAYAFARDGDGEWRPLETPGAFVYGTGPFIDPHGFTDAIWRQSEVCGFKLEMLTSEFDAPQFEFTLRYDDAVDAIDDVFLFRQMAREVALEHGILLTFMPKPVAGLSGSGVHVNFSLENENGDNIIADATADDGLSALARGCVAGLLHHHRALAGLLAPTVNSYQRLQPATLSGYWRNWARDHRGVTVRVASETGRHARIEHRMADAAANPYTMAAAVLQAARLGVAGEYELPPAETADCLENHDATDGTPESLAAALDELENDRALTAAVGEELVANHIAIKRDEVTKTANLTVDDLRDFYLHFV